MPIHLWRRSVSWPAWPRAEAPAALRRLPRHTAPGRAAGFDPSLLREALLQPVLEAAIEIRVDRQVVGEQLGVDLLDFGRALVLLPGVDRSDADRQRDHRRDQPQRHAAPATELPEHVVGPGERRSGLRTQALERLRARAREPRRPRLVQLQSPVQDVPDLVAELHFVHGFLGTPPVTTFMTTLYRGL